MSHKDLEAFGKKLRQLRKAAGFYQEELAEKLSLMQSRVVPRADLKIDGNRVSKWERFFKDREGRAWPPKREHVLGLIELFASQLDPEEAQTWAGQAGYQLSQEELYKLFPAVVELPVGLPGLSDLQPNHLWLRLPAEQFLFGVEQPRGQLRPILEQPGSPWLIALDGIGGIGKTSLAGVLAHDLMATGRFHDLAWVSAKQEEFLPGDGVQPLSQPALTVESLVDGLLEQLHPQPVLTASFPEKLAILTDLLAKQPYLIVIDNLETVSDYQALLPRLRQLANPAKFLLTSRHSLRGYSDVYCFSLKELNQADTLTLLKHEAEVRGIEVLAQASPDQLERIYHVVGGNPLALKLVIGQICVLSLPEVLENLREAQGKKIDDLYTYIYWQAWQALDEAGRAVLLVMPLAHGGDLNQLLELSELEQAPLEQALERLATLSLVEVGGDLDRRRYYIHRLTETFLLREVIKWQQLP
jgi:transcriptional regulator with XRE-family HTH domain